MCEGYSFYLLQHFGVFSLFDYGCSSCHSIKMWPEEEDGHNISSTNSMLQISMYNIIRDMNKTGSLYDELLRDIFNWVTGVMSFESCLYCEQSDSYRKERII